MIKSINEPGTESVDEQIKAPTLPQSGEPPQPALPPLPSNAELTAMTRAELDALAESRGLDSPWGATKADVIALLKNNA